MLLSVDAMVPQLVEKFHGHRDAIEIGELERDRYMDIATETALRVETSMKLMIFIQLRGL